MGDRSRETDAGEGRGPVLYSVGLPSDGNEEDTVSEEGDGQTCPQQAEVTMAQRREYRHSTDSRCGHLGTAIAALGSTWTWCLLHVKTCC